MHFDPSQPRIKFSTHNNSHLISNSISVSIGIKAIQNNTKMPSPIEIRPHPTKHRALHATRAFKASQIIHTFNPLILHPSQPHLSSVCTHCLRPGSPRACSRCHAAYYCDAACQQAGWTTVHSKECKVLRQRKLGSKTGADLPTPVRALLQTLLCKNVEQAVAGLDGHMEQRRRGKGWPNLEMMALAACSFAGRQGHVREAVELLCKVRGTPLDVQYPTDKVSLRRMPFTDGTSISAT
jgi:SET and MYND domain-containing protein